MARKKSKHIRIEFKKNRETRQRQADLTKDFHQSDEEIDTKSSERVSGKGNLTRRRTVTTEDDGRADNQDAASVLAVSEKDTLLGRVLRVHGLECVVSTEREEVYRCAVRRLLKTVSTDQRHVVVAGDLVRFRPEGKDQGLIVRVEPRRSQFCRSVRGKRHVLVSNVDQLLIVTSAAEPNFKPNLIDRFLITAEQNELDACICINKCDLIDPAELQQPIGVYAQMGYRVVMLSVQEGWGIEEVKNMLGTSTSVVVGQSGVGKSSLLNALFPEFNLRVQTVSEENQKGRHTTTTASLLKLPSGATLVDTPGIRQFQLWDIVPEELTTLFRDFRPFADLCRFPNCSHQHETDCAVKDAVADGLLDVRRYDSFCHILSDGAPSQGGVYDYEDFADDM